MIDILLRIFDILWIWPVYSLIILLVLIFGAGRYGIYRLDNQDRPYVDRKKGIRPDWKS